MSAETTGSIGGATAEGRAYRLCVGLLLLNDGGEAWVGRRVDFADNWQLPQGGIDPGEAPRDAALRELREEIGTDKAEILAESGDWLAYDFPPELGSANRLGRYRGQRMKWFALRFTGSEADIDLQAHDNPEFDAWRWVPPATLPGLIIPFKRPVYEAMLQEFQPVIDRVRKAAFG